MRSSFALLAAGSLAITALGRLVDFETAPEVNTGSGDSPLTAELLGGGNPDVVVWDLQSYQNYSPQGGYHAYALGTTSCNQGDVPLLWQSNTNLHPVIGQNMYRWKDGRFEQIGMGWLKHGFYALSLSDCGPCQGTDGTTLGINCSDPYTASRNGSQGGLGPKYQVNATTGYFPYPPANPSYSGSTARRCRVPSSDVIPSENPGAVYFMEGQYVCPDDSPDDTGDASNNSSHRRLNMASSGAISSFAGPTIQELPAIASWDDLDPEVDLHEIEIPGEGTVWFGSRVFDEGNGTYRYEYAIFNLNFDRSIGAMRLPWNAANPLTQTRHFSPEWHSGEMFTNEGWTMALEGSEMVWSSESFGDNNMANAVRWANLQNITIVSSAPPTQGTVTLDVFKPGPFDALFVDTTVPGNATVGVSFPNGTPNVIDPASPVEFAMDIEPISIDPEPNSGVLYVNRASGQTDVYPMVEQSSNQHRVTFGDIECLEEINYYFSIDTTSGEKIYFPGGGESAPGVNSMFPAIGAFENVTTFDDGFESDFGWSVSGNATDGGWTRGVPVPDCDRGNPTSTPDGSTSAYLTDNSNNGGDCNSDVDGGQTILTSPALDASNPESIISYSRWLDNSFGASPGEDPMTIEVSSDDGANWTLLELVGPVAEADGGWYDKSFRIGDFVENTDTFRIRFIAEDTGNGSVVEAGVDAIQITGSVCDEGPACPADLDGNGSVDFNDLVTVLGGWGCSNCPEDINGDGITDFNDLVNLLSAYGPCE